MKRRSHERPVSEPHSDDWADGSWTVDCICGVNYDDGREMVACDECGVWMHTRCTSFVNREDLFACDKCKSKNSGGPKSVRAAPPSRPNLFREDRVHVHGVPGGEPGLVSGIFGPELWKSTGYIPKKFNFRDTDFPCLGHQEEKDKELVRTSSGEEKCANEYSRHLSKIPESTELSYTSDSTKPSSDSKGSSLHPSPKVSLVPNAALNRVSRACSTSPRHIVTASNVQNKAEPGKVEKLSQSGIHPSARGNVASVMAPTSANVPATTSDEEHALLLHQELNSSPRVPREPHMRHAGSLPQLTGPSATSVLIKRTSSGGGKDQTVASSRRRTMGFLGEGTHGFVEADNEAKKMERKPISPNFRRRDSGYGADPLSRRETDGGRAKSVQSMKKTNMRSSLSSSPDASGHKLSSNRPSSRTMSDDDPRMVGRQTNRTLPGLISEIMREGKRITYEELCNLVLPHWPHLRKHNGERYAYSSHSQAVLDCLRNRSEWASLVDRGPMSTSIRTRRKSAADSVCNDSEDNKGNIVKKAKDSGSYRFESHHGDIPKGKRNARKSRHLALQGRGIVGRRRRAEIVSDDESEPCSTSSEENNSSSEEEE